MAEDHIPAHPRRSAHFRSRRVQSNWNDEGIRLQEAIRTQDWFLDPRFSLSQLSERVGLNTNYASHALNFGLGKPFKSVLNELRVEHAKTLIQQDRESLLTIALNSGFGSKASFNRHFLNLTGKTPSQFRYDARLENEAGAKRQAPARGADHVS